MGRMAAAGPHRLLTLPALPSRCTVGMSAHGPDATSPTPSGVDVIKAHPYRPVLTVLSVMVVCGFTAAMIGQHNSGPWGGLPEWLGAVTWFGFLASVLAIVVLSVYLLVAHLRWRKEQGTRREPVS